METKELYEYLQKFADKNFDDAQFDTFVESLSLMYPDSYSKEQIALARMCANYAYKKAIQDSVIANIEVLTKLGLIIQDKN